MTGEFGNGNGKLPFLAFSNKRRVYELGPTQQDTADLIAQLQQSRAAMAALTQTLMASTRHSTAVQEKLDAVEKTNSYLRRELKDVESRAATVNHLAYHDALTGLPNRRLLLERLVRATAQASRQHSVALLFAGIDGLKIINDKLGHATGDKLLQGVAQRLCACLRTADTACRYGNDEFSVILLDVTSGQSMQTVEQKIRTTLSAPYLVDGVYITVTLSIGTAVYPSGASNHWDLIKLADLAMYSAKTNGRGAPRIENSVTDH